MRLGLQAKYAGSIFALIGFVALLLSAALLFHFRNVMTDVSEASVGAIADLAQRQLENHGLEFAQQLADTLTVPFYYYRTQQLYELLHRARLHHSVDYATLVDAQGRLIQDGISRESSDFGRQLPHPMVRRLSESPGPVVLMEGGMLHIAVPVSYNNRRLGGLLIGYSTDMLNQRLDTLRQRLQTLRQNSLTEEVAGVAVLVAVLLLLGTLLAIRLAKHLSRPIRALALDAERLGQGGSGHFALDRSDELGDLANSLARMQDNLQRSMVSNRYLEDIVNSLHDVLLVTGPEGRIRLANQAAWRMFGYHPDELSGRPVELLVAGPPECRGLADWHNRDNVGVHGRECWFRGRNGDKIAVSVAVSRLPETGNTPPGMVFSVQGISERRAMEDELRRYRENLEQLVAERTRELSALNRELESFSYSVSHDLRTPLRALNGFSQALIEDYGGQLDETAKGYLDRIRASSERMSHMIDGLLTLSRVTRSDLNRETVDLSNMAAEILREMAEAEPRRNAAFDIRPGILVQGDSALLRVLMQNLLNNAWKFTGGRKETRIEFGRRTEGGESVLFVRDNGAGFDPADADKLFQPFQRLHRDEQYEGTGIGLATVQRIVSRHGGRIWAEGEPDKGATISFVLPPVGPHARAPVPLNPPV